jgi:hypothetical protein
MLYLVLPLVAAALGFTGTSDAAVAARYGLRPTRDSHIPRFRRTRDKGPAAPRVSTALRAVLHSARASLRYGRFAVTRSPR